MISDNLFDEVLLQPSIEGADELFIVSGYATAAMAFHHLESLQNLQNENMFPRVHLIIGMASMNGLSISNHQAFKHIVESEFPHNFECSYVISGAPVHSKIYSWYKDNSPSIGFVGSANYTQQAFGANQREAMGVIEAVQGRQYYENLISDSIYCNHLDAEDYIEFYNYRREITNGILETENNETVDIPNSGELRSVAVSLLSRDGTVASRSGLNWGQRPEEGREPNQAYIRLTSNIYNTDFFPERGQHFTLLTDDNKVLICTRAQDNGKAIHTPQNNSLIGEYFRNRLGVPFGNMVTNGDLAAYGRDEITFYKIDEETYFMDFSQPTHG